MAKMKLKLVGVWSAWNDQVKAGQLVRDDGNSQDVLVRTLDVSSDKDTLQRLRQDARLLSRIRHASALRLIHVSAVGDNAAVVFEGCQGASLANIMSWLANRGHQLPMRAALELGEQVATALAAGLVVRGDSGERVGHPGPEPGEILIDAQGQVKLAGFAAYGADEPPAPVPGFGPPDDEHDVDKAASYGLGALLIEVLTGERAAAGSRDPNRHEVMIRRALIRVLARQGETAPEAVVNLVRQCMARDPSARPPVDLFSRRLAEVAAGLKSEPLSTWAAQNLPAVLATYAQGQAPPSEVDTLESPRAATGSSGLVRAPGGADRVLPPLDDEPTMRASALSSLPDMEPIGPDYEEAATIGGTTEDTDLLMPSPKRPVAHDYPEMANIDPDAFGDEEPTRVAPAIDLHGDVASGGGGRAGGISPSTDDDYGDEDDYDDVETGGTGKILVGVAIAAVLLLLCSGVGVGGYVAVESGVVDLGALFSSDGGSPDEAVEPGADEEGSDEAAGDEATDAAAGDTAEGEAEGQGSADEAAGEASGSTGSSESSGSSSSSTTGSSTAASSGTGTTSSSGSSTTGASTTGGSTSSRSTTSGGSSGTARSTSSSGTNSTGTSSTTARTSSGATSSGSSTGSQAGGSQAGGSQAGGSQAGGSQTGGSQTVVVNTSDYSGGSSARIQPTATTTTATTAATTVPATTAADTSAGASSFQVQFVSADPSVTSMEIKCHVGASTGASPVTIAGAGRGPCKVVGRRGDERLVVMVSLTGPKTFTCFSGGERSCR